MELYCRKTGTGIPLVILHGLYGSSDNWMSIVKLLEKYFEIFIPDQRNHGRSPHSDDFNYSLLTQDMYEFFQQNKISKTVLLGHSMGGKVAMHFAREFPELLSSLIVVDIAPKNYSSSANSPESLAHISISEALNYLHLPEIKSREEADKLLSVSLPQDKLRSFLLKNLRRNDKGNFEWSINLNSIQKNFSEISEGFSPKIWNNTEITGFPVLFVKGALSNYITDKDVPLINKIFPGAEIYQIAKAGHWLHAEKPEQLAKKILSFTFK